MSNPRLSVVDTLSKLSHDNDAMVSQGAIFSLGLVGKFQCCILLESAFSQCVTVGAGTNNARIAGLLRQLSAYYSKDNQQLFVVRLAQVTKQGSQLPVTIPFDSTMKTGHFALRKRNYHT